MRITKVRVTDFQSIRDSTEFDIGDVTCLVGKNEAGKTALLQAMYRLLPIVDTDVGYSVTDDPRRDVADYEHAIEEEEREHAVVAQLTYELDDADAGAIAKVFGPKALASREITISKAYEQDTITFSVLVDDQAALHHILSGYSVPDETRKALESCSTPAEAKKVVTDLEQTEAIQSITEWLNEIVSAGSVKDYICDKILNPLVPRFLYFDEYYQMRGCDNIDALQQRVADEMLEKPDHPMLGLIRKARLDLDSLLNPRRTRDLKNKLEGAGNHLTKSIVKYWSQNKNLQMRFDVRPAQPEDPQGMQNGTNIWAEVYDTLHMVTTELGTRSRGFVWFFSFLAWYGDVQRDKQNVIILLDEPGLSLHGKAQGDLLTYFEEELVPNHQLIYSTHSPFMIDPARFNRVRIVQDRSIDADQDLPDGEAGTKVTIDVLESSDDSLFPLQGALGYDIAQTLFVGPNSLIVEGVSDMQISVQQQLTSENAQLGLGRGSRPYPRGTIPAGPDVGRTAAVLEGDMTDDIKGVEIFAQFLDDHGHTAGLGRHLINLRSTAPLEVLGDGAKLGGGHGGVSGRPCRPSSTRRQSSSRWCWRRASSIPRRARRALSAR